jgi:hypothetical protein
MRERDKSTAEKLMEMITTMDCDPSVFRVVVARADHTDGYDAIATFRDDTLKELVIRGYAPEVALREMYTRLERDYAPCPHCGRRASEGE